jgi:hypothetical protein
MTTDEELGLPTPPEGYVWVIRRWDFSDYEIFPYPRFGKLLVGLATDFQYIPAGTPYWPRVARALASPRSIRLAAFRALRRHEAEMLAGRERELRDASGARVAKRKARKMKEQAREAAKNAPVVQYLGTYPPKKLRDR